MVKRTNTPLNSLTRGCSTIPGRHINWLINMLSWRELMVSNVAWSWWVWPSPDQDVTIVPMLRTDVLHEQLSDYLQQCFLKLARGLPYLWQRFLRFASRSWATPMPRRSTYNNIAWMLLYVPNNGALLFYYTALLVRTTCTRFLDMINHQIAVHRVSKLSLPRLLHAKHCVDKPRLRDLL